MISRQYKMGLACLLAVTLGGLLLATAPVAATSHTCSVNGADDYQDIQTAVDNAAAGDTVVCRGDFGSQQVTIDKPLTLEGDDALLEGGQGTAITVASDDVTVEGFVIRSYDRTGIDVAGDADTGDLENVTLSNNAVSQTDYGVNVSATDGATVSDVTVTESLVNESREVGVYVWAGGDGHVTGVNVSAVQVNDSQWHGILVSTGRVSAGGTVTDVDIRDALLETNFYGVRFEAQNGGHTADVSVRNAAAVDSGRKGIYLRAYGDGTLDGATVTRSVINGTEQAYNQTSGEPIRSAGVYLQALADGDLTDVTVEENAIVDNHVAGIETDTRTGTMAGETISWNYIGGNHAGVINLDDDRVVDATLNYWGDSSGPSSDTTPPLKDPEASVFADGQGDNVSQGPDVDGYAASNVRFAPAIGGKSTCEDTPIHVGDQLVDLVPNEDVREQLGTDVDISTEVEGHAIEGPLTDFVGLCLWDRSVLPLRADDTDAATRVQGPDLTVKHQGVEPPLRKDILAVYNQSRTVPFEWSTDVTGTADQDMFANEDAQFVVAKVTGNATGDFSLQTDAETGDVTFDSSELEIVEIQDTRLDADADLTQDVAYTTDDGVGVFVAMLVTDTTGDGFSDLEEGTTVNVHESDLTVIGMDAIAVQTTASDVTPEYQTAALGEDVGFEIDARLGRTSGVDHALVFFDKETMRDTSATITDWEFDLNASNRTVSGNVTVEVDPPYDPAETITMNATDVVLEGGMLTGTLRRDGDETTVETETDLISGQLLVVGDPSMVDGDATNTTAGDRTELTISTQTDWNPATYQYAHVAAIEDGNFSTNWGTVEMVAPDEDASDIRVTGGSLSETEIEEGETVDVEGTLQNFGSDAGTHTVELRVDGDVQDTQDVTLGVGDLTTVAFTTDAFDEAGEYDVYLDGLKVGTVTVEAAPTAPPGGGLPPGGGGGLPPVSTPDVPTVTTPTPDTVVVDVPPGFLSFDLEIPSTDAQAGAAVRLTRLTARSSHSQGITTTVDTAPGPPHDVPALDSGQRGHLYLDVTYDVDSSAWRSSTFHWQVSKDRFPSRAAEDFALYRYDDATDEWEPIDTELLEETDEHYRFRSDADGFSVYAVGTRQAAPDVQVTGASLGTPQIQAGESVDVQAIVENRGDEAGTFTVDLVVDGEVLASQAVSIEAGATETVEFTPTFVEPGTYEVAINDVTAGTLQVNEGPNEAPGEPEGGLHLFLYVFFFLVIISIAAGAYYYAAQRQIDRV